MRVSILRLLFLCLSCHIYALLRQIQAFFEAYGRYEIENDDLKEALYQRCGHYEVDGVEQGDGIHGGEGSPIAREHEAENYIEGKVQSYIGDD